ncbi:MAG: cation:proton antiporter [Clostridia bacterium]
MSIIFILCFALLAGLIFTRLMKLLRLPNVTGYLIAGVLIGPHVFKLITAQHLEMLEIITNVALGFIAFSIGTSIKLSLLKKLGKNILVITAMQALLATILVDLVMILIGEPLPFALILGAVATATAPAATLMIVRQYKAKGPVTETLLPVVALDDALGLMVFAISLAIGKVLHVGGSLSFVSAFLVPVCEILLALVIGSALGFILALVSRFFKSRANRLTLIITFTLGGIALAELLNLSSLLLCMMIGTFYGNLFKENEVPLEVLERWTYPLFMLFFVISGAQLNLEVLPTVGIVGFVYIVVRAIGKWGGAYLGAVITKANPNVRKYLGIALFPQAGVAIGMASVVMAQLPEIGQQVTTVVLCATLVYEILGPLLTKIALTKAGEIEKTPKRIKNSATSAQTSAISLGQIPTIDNANIKELAVGEQNDQPQTQNVEQSQQDFDTKTLFEKAQQQIKDNESTQTPSKETVQSENINDATLFEKAQQQIKDNEDSKNLTNK